MKLTVQEHLNCVSRAISGIQIKVTHILYIYIYIYILLCDLITIICVCRAS